MITVAWHWEVWVILLLLILFSVYLAFQLGQKKGWDKGVEIGEKHGYENGRRDQQEGNRIHAPH